MEIINQKRVCFIRAGVKAWLPSDGFDLVKIIPGAIPIGSKPHPTAFGRLGFDCLAKPIIQLGQFAFSPKHRFGAMLNRTANPSATSIKGIEPPGAQHAIAMSARPSQRPTVPVPGFISALFLERLKFEANDMIPPCWWISAVNAMKGISDSKYRQMHKRFCDVTNSMST